jgi:hypothetical protein
MQYFREKSQERLSRDTEHLAGVAVMLWTCIWEVLGLNLGLATVYPYVIFMVFLSPSRQIPGQCFPQIMKAYLQIPPNATFTSCPTA